MHDFKARQGRVSTVTLDSGYTERAEEWNDFDILSPTKAIIGYEL